MEETEETEQYSSPPVLGHSGQARQGSPSFGSPITITLIPVAEKKFRETNDNFPISASHLLSSPSKSLESILRMW